MNVLTTLRTKLHNRFEWLRWWFWLRSRVGGRIKLRGNLKRLRIAPTFRCDGDLWLGIYSSVGEIRIEDDVSASGPLVITAVNSVTVGRGVLLGPNVMVTDHYHGDPRDPATFDIAPSRRALHSRGPIHIGDFVQVGANVSILSPTSIGHSAVIGANAVVTGELQAKTVHVGIPARPLHPSHQSVEK
jgi:acetyltransferase-like isoleucine patch superfamily enzyme